MPRLRTTDYTASRMLVQRDTITQHIRVENARDALHISLEGRSILSRGVQDDIPVLQLTALVQWLRLSHTGNNAHKVLLGN